MAKKIQKSCIKCGATFECYRSSYKKYCGRACYGSIRQTKDIACECSFCGKIYFKAPHRAKISSFCNKECQYNELKESNWLKTKSACNQKLLHDPEWI